jgi:Ca2+-binding EF-hand superfamily protein
LCTGDCNGDGAVTVEELVQMVNIALGSTGVTDCSAGDANRDGRITIEEVVTAVNRALNGCQTRESANARRGWDAVHEAAAKG